MHADSVPASDASTQLHSEAPGHMLDMNYRFCWKIRPAGHQDINMHGGPDCCPAHPAQHRFELVSEWVGRLRPCGSARDLDNAFTWLPLSRGVA